MLIKGKGQYKYQEIEDISEKKETNSKNSSIFKNTFEIFHKFNKPYSSEKKGPFKYQNLELEGSKEKNGKTQPNQKKLDIFNDAFEIFQGFDKSCCPESSNFLQHVILTKDEIESPEIQNLIKEIQNLQRVKKFQKRANTSAERIVRINEQKINDLQTLNLDHESKKLLKNKYLDNIKEYKQVSLDRQKDLDEVQIEINKLEVKLNKLRELN